MVLSRKVRKRTKRRVARAADRDRDIPSLTSEPFWRAEGCRSSSMGTAIPSGGDHATGGASQTQPDPCQLPARRDFRGLGQGHQSGVGGGEAAVVFVEVCEMLAVVSVQPVAAGAE